MEIKRLKQFKLLGLCVLAACAMAALTSSPTLAATHCPKNKILYGATCETLQEHSSFQAFADCPLIPEVVICVTGKSYYQETFKSKKEKEAYLAEHPEYVGGQVSYFTAGKVTVPLKRSISLRGGFESFEGANLNEYQWVAAVGGAPSIEPVAQPSIPITKGVNTALLSKSELERYDYVVHHGKETKTTATVELAGPVSNLKISLADIIFEEGNGFVFPVKVKLSNPFLGENCYVGSDASPIEVPFTTGPSGPLHGKFGTISAETAGEILLNWGQTLVSTEFAAPGVQGCGVEGGADEAVDSALGLPAPTGNTSVLNGVLRLIGRESAEQGLKGEI